MTDVFSRIGYTLSEALADVIDNSIDAGATRVFVQFHRSDTRINRITIADDGSGMTSAHLARIMQFGVRSESSGARLGKYGIGLKTASFSQCSAFTVITRSNGVTSARRWSFEMAKQGWRIEVIEADAAAAFWKREWAAMGSSPKSGTIVVWDSLQRLVAESGGLEKALAKLRTGLRIELGLRFHRFIESGRIQLCIRERCGDSGGPPEPVPPLDPFGYGGKSGRRGYPITFSVLVGGSVRVEAEAHIWPPKSQSPMYKLGAGAVVKRQGFYFYRNDRLIAAGGWHGCKSEEPHSSLARVKVDLPTELDALFQLTVQKTGCSPPPEFLEGLRSARVGDTSFADYLEAAQSSYRNAPTEQVAIAVPGSGLPRSFSAAMRRLIKSRHERCVPRRVGFEWKVLPHDKVIETDLAGSRVILNSRYRSKLFGRRPSSKASVPFLAMLFLNLQESFAYERAGKRVQEQTAQVNDVLLMVVGAQG
jgi:hypothetical protein